MAKRKRVYLDNAATTPLHPEVAALMVQLLEECFGNPSSLHTEGRRARTYIDEARKGIAKLLGVATHEIVFTSGGTEADNMAIARAVTDVGVTDIITSPIEHHAVLHAVEAQESEKNVSVHYLKPDAKGYIQLRELEAKLEELKGKKVLVSLMHANNEIGTFLPLKEVGELCENFGALLHSDTVQTIGHCPLDLKRCKVHFATASAHKFHGPKGIGLLYLDERIKIKPHIHGGSQERALRGGTENVYAIAAMHKAMELAYDELDSSLTRLQNLKLKLWKGLQETVPGVLLNGDAVEKSLCTILNVGFPPSEVGDMLHFSLDIEGVACSGGSACTSGSAVGSHVIAHIGIEEGYIPVRFSLGAFTKEEDIDYALYAVSQVMTPILS